MRRASSKFLSHLWKPQANTPISLISRDFAAATSDHSFTRSSRPHLKSCSRNRSLLFSNHSSYRPCQNLNTVADSTVQNASSSRQSKIKENSELEEAFESAESLDEMLKAFKDMEERFDEKDLGLACLKIGLKLDREGEDPENILSFAQRALRIIEDNDDSSAHSSSKLSLPVALTLQLLGSSSFRLKRFNDSLGYLNRANRLLRKLEGDTSFPPDQVLLILDAIQYGMFNVKTAMGRREEAVSDLRKALEIKEKILAEDSKELGNAHREVAEAYVSVMNFKEALPFCLTALELHSSYFGHNSVEVAHDRRLLGVIYTGLEEHQKALEQNQLSRKVLKKWGRNSDLLRAEIVGANMQIALGRYDEAINALKVVVRQTEQDSEDRAMVFTSMAKALCSQDELADAKRCLEIACGILGKKERSSPLVVVEVYMEIAKQYEAMNEFETAISLLKKALIMLERLPQQQDSVGSVSAKIGWLLQLIGNVEQGIPYLEDAIERLKESFGSKHFSVGYAYYHLGAAYLEVDRPQSAAQAFSYAKEIMDVSLGPHHADSIEACQYLSKAYAAMGSYPLAINIQEKVVEGLEGHGRSAKDKLDEAVRVLNELKKKAISQVPQAVLDATPNFPDNDDGTPNIPNNEEPGSAENPESAN